MVLEVTHSNWCAGVESMAINVAVQHFTPYKYLIYLALITISHHIFLAFLGFFSLALY
jgi:hypothetical protein